ncbi:hypothetical protein FHS29_003688 [Saccharothrix tamanrassetensis]|uniref:Uncharacterized protein n=1 Tax=Saccharothrix tamanrassetensis TaxID=1051531 RepID=A0A841CM62_9PSEU|nr:hypothetical protein [Saccharothrix tamanrassetensis]MBB5957095.1 hypothetical protein [Saccharothrix tamanrassetensis]
MTEQQEVLADFGAAGVLAGLRWAYLSATNRALEDYSEADGHDAAWLGNTRFTLFRNRLDRVFHCERYAAPEEDSGLDELYARLSGRDIDTMPRVEPGVVRRSNLNNSPGWAVGARRFLLAAGEFGKLDELAWARRSTTKQRVALQREPHPAQPSLFEHLAEEEVGGLFALSTRSLDLDTYVVAHSLDPVSRQAELILGRARLNAGGGPAWAWRTDVLRMPAAGGSRRTPKPVPVGPDTAPDAPVRLRGRAGQPGFDQPADRAHDSRADRPDRRGGRAGGER